MVIEAHQKWKKVHQKNPIEPEGLLSIVQSFNKIYLLEEMEVGNCGKYMDGVAIQASLDGMAIQARGPYTAASVLY